MLRVPNLHAYAESKPWNKIDDTRFQRRVYPGVWFDVLSNVLSVTKFPQDATRTEVT